MPTDITYNGDEREVEFQVVDDLLAPVAWANVLGLILVVYAQPQKILLRYSKNAKPNFTPITNITDAANGKFEIVIPSEVTAPADAVRNLTWEAKVTIANTNFPDNEQDFISKGILTELDESVVRNITTT